MKKIPRIFKAVSRALIPSLLILFTSLSLAVAEQPPPYKKDPGRLFSELMHPYRNMVDYTVAVDARVSMKLMKVPDFKATLYFKRPDKFHIETRSFAPLPRNSGNFNPFLFDPQKNRIAHERSEELAGIKTEVFRVEPLQGETRVRFYYVWVDVRQKRVLQVESHTLKGNRVLVKPSYRLVPLGGELLPVPDKVHVHMTLHADARNLDSSLNSSRDNPFSRGMASPEEMPWEGDVYISYGDWKINTGLDDKLFPKGKK